jgi:hypothetical protein
MEDLLHELLELEHVHHAATRLQIDEEVHIARFRGVATGGRIEDPRARGPSSPLDLDDRVASFG